MAKRRLGKLTVILHADVAGSTALVQQDEHLAHDRMQDAFRRFGEVIGRYRGRVSELRGDALLAEFERASDAVSAVLAFQTSQREANAGYHDGLCPEVRAGIAMGEVVVADDTVTGAGVVLAQRVEQFAEPGGLCVTAAIHEALPGRMPFVQSNLGEHELKGFDEPVRIYRVDLESGEPVPPPPQQSLSRSAGSRKTWGAVAVAVAVLGAGAAYWFVPRQVRDEPASIERMAFLLPDKPSIAVLPFANLSDDKAQEFFADGITNDIITDLSRFGDLMVIAANSTFTYKGKPVKVQQVAEDLGIRYVVEGSVQTADDKVRINAQFIDALTGEHLWAERYVRDLGDVFKVQDEITQRVVNTLAGFSGEVTDAILEQARNKATTDLSAYENFLISLELLQRFNQKDNARARKLAERAIELDPAYARPHFVLAWTHYFDWQRGWSESEKLSAERAHEAASRAVALDESEPLAHVILATVLSHIRRQPEAAVVSYERALTLAPGDPDILADWGGFSMPFLTGKAEEGMSLVKKAMRLNPIHPDWYEQAYGLAAYIAQRYEEAIAALKKVEYHGVESRAALAASYAQLGSSRDAKQEVEKLLELQPEFSIDRFEEKLYFKNAGDREHFIDGLRVAGLPEHSPLRLPDKPSIAVLPFDNMSDDARQEYFVDGMTEDLITDLSRLSGLFVIARNSVFAYKGKVVDIQRAADDLGVRYVMEGSVRRAGGRVRINAQLIDAKTGGHLWAERYDGSLEDVFALQDLVTGKIVEALKVELLPEETTGAWSKTVSTEAYDAYLRGQESFRRDTVEGYIDSIDHFEKAIRHDPDYARAYASLAAVYWYSAINGWSVRLGLNFADASIRSKGYLELAMKEPSPLAHQVASERASTTRQSADEALAQANSAITLDPNDPSGHLAMANALIKAKRPDAAVLAIQRAIRLDPLYPSSYLRRLGRAQLAARQFELSVNTLEEALRRNAQDEWTMVFMIAAYGHLGLSERASSLIEKANVVRAELNRGALTWENVNVELYRDRLSSYRHGQQGMTGDRNTVREGLLKAGLGKGYEWITRIRSFTPTLEGLDTAFEAEGATTIDVLTARELHERGVPFVEIDTGTWLRGHVPGAHLMAWLHGEFNESSLAAVAGKDKEIVISGWAGDTTVAAACAEAVVWGFTKVYCFPEGVVGWERAGYPLQRRN